MGPEPNTTIGNNALCPENVVYGSTGVAPAVRRQARRSKWTQASLDPTRESFFDMHVTRAARYSREK
jgi:hypothetical protein